MSDTSHPSQPLHRHEFTTVDKSDWGPGPWQDEPDKVAWVDPDTGLDCMAKRHERLGHWCGYVGVGPDHPWFRVGFGECADPEHGEECQLYCEHSPAARVEAHGGITYARGCDEPTEEEWLKVDERLGDPYLRAEAERHPHGDRAWLLKRLERQGGMAFEEWVEDQRPHRVCHIPPPGQPEEVWWFGFDCAHLGDHSPGVNGSFPSPADDEYRSLFYVERRVAELACQLAEIGR